MGLKKYKTKRDFSKTPEPKEAQKRSMQKLPVFVVQRHKSRRLHYDFRIEHKGVLPSWAIPKGPSKDPEVKRLAIKTEDHPYDYKDFAGTIPRGEYGAGTIEIWDSGTYMYPEMGDFKDIEKQIAKGLKKGKIVITLSGNKLKGDYSLVRFDTDSKQDTWLFFKMKDNTTKKSAHSLVFNDAAISRLADITAELKQKYPELEQTKLPKKLKPMQVLLVDEPFDGKEWLFEMKLDGYRAVAEVDKRKIKLYSRNFKDLAADFQPVLDSLEQVYFDAVFDGELVVVDSKGKPDFQMLQNYIKTGDGDLVYYVFDILYFNGFDLRGLSLRERKRVLKAVLPKLHNIKYLDHIVGKGKAFFRAAEKEGLEGIIAKKADSRYQSGERTKDWQKIKTYNVIDAIIVGYTAPERGRKYFGSLALAVYEGKKLKYIGNVGTGFAGKALKEVFSLFKPRKSSPFDSAPTVKHKITWVKPVNVCQVKFAEWTKEGYLRQPVFLGINSEAVASEVKLIRKVKQERIFKTQEKVTKLRVDNEEVKVTNLDKIYWPDDGYTKQDLIDYYLEIADYILPYLKDRPLTLHRYPEGIHNEGFFHKDMQEAHPKFVKTTTIYSKSAEKEIHYVLCQNKATLAYLANLGTIELHPWHSRSGNLNKPDYVILDLDPHGVTFKAVVEAALVTKKLLDEIKVPGSIKTSGFTGLHIYIPMEARYTYKQALQLLEIIQTIINHKLPETTSIERSPEKRKNRIYLDILQNTRGQTIVAPYSVRPGTGATVSTPLLWKEVSDKLNPSKFTIKTVIKRLDKRGDIWQGVLGRGIDIKKVLKEIEKKYNDLLSG